MNNKKLIFILGCPRSSSTLLLSYLCGIPNSKVLYESKLLLKDRDLLDIANYLDSIEEEIVIEKTPEHVYRLEDIEKLRELCKRDIYIIYIIRPPVPTILSLLKASKDSPELFGEVDLLGACEKYEKSLVNIYNHLILKSNKEYPKYGHREYFINTPYSLCVSYRELIEDSYKVLEALLGSLYIEANIQSLIDNRIGNTQKSLPFITKEKHHSNVLRDIQEVEIERREKIGIQITEGFSDNYIERSNYIRNYFEHPLTKETVYDLVVNKKILEIENYPLVTIIVPLYNKESYIEETLISLLTQTYQNIRVVVIDDSSTDNSLEVVERYFESLPQKLQDKLWIIRGKHNLGVSFTRNIGLAGYADIFSFCDADDTWDKTLVEKSVNTFIKYPYVGCVYSRVLGKKEELLEKIPSKICNGNIYSDALEYQFLNCGSNLFVKASVIKDNEIKFNEGFSGCEDWDFLIQLSKVAVFKCTKEYLVTYRQDVLNSISSDRAYQFEDCKRVIEKYLTNNRKFKRIFTRHYFYYFSTKLLKWGYIKDLDLNYILKVVINKFKSFVKSYLP